MTLDQLYDNNLLSKRGMNFCLANNLLSLEAIKAYHQRNGTFKKLSACVSKINAELVALAKNQDDENAELLSDPLQISIEELSAIHKYARAQFSQRSKVVCKLNNLHTTGDIVNHFKEHGTFTDLKKTGKQTTAELISICHMYQVMHERYIGQRMQRDTA